MLKYISIIGITASIALLYNTSVKKSSELHKSIGILVSPVNDTRLKEPGTLHWTHLSKDTKVSDGDTIFTGENSSSTMKFNDHTEVTIHENSIVIFRGDMIELEQGNLDINLNQLSQKRSIKVSGKIYTLGKSGTFKVEGQKEESHFTFIPRDVPAPPVQRSEQIVQPEPVPKQFFTPRRVVAKTDQKYARTAEISVPTVPETLSEAPHENSVPASTETPPERKERQWTLYAILSRGSQKNEISPTLNGTTLSKNYSVSGSSVYVRAEVENLVSKPVAVSVSANDYSGNSSDFKSQEVSAEVILRSKHRLMKNIDLMPGLYVRQYTFTIDKFQPTDVTSSKLESQSLMLGLSGRWEKNFDSWVAEIWPQIRVYSKSDFLFDYSVLGGLGRETRVGRFSVYFNWRRFKDSLTIQEADGDTEVNVTETRLGAGYVYRF